MISSLDFARQILLKRMIKTLEGEGYRVEFAEEYNGFIVAGHGEDPAVMLLDADTIENHRVAHPGSASQFVEGILNFVQSQISASDTTSFQPPVRGEEAGGYADVATEPPSAVGVDEDMIVGDESMGDTYEEVEPAEAGLEEVPVDEFEEGLDEEADVPIDEDEPGAEEPPAEETEQQRLNDEVTEELTLEDFDEQESEE